MEVASRTHHAYRGGAWFVELAPVAEADVVAEVVASALGLDPEPGRDPIERVCDHIGAEASLLVLDN